MFAAMKISSSQMFSYKGIGGYEMIGYLSAIVVLIGVDQAVKIWAMQELMPIGTIPLIENVFHLTYVKNYGAAFSILQDKRIFLIIITDITLGIALYILISKKMNHSCANWSIALIVAGGIGNLIDRIRLGFVVDYLDFRLINFPVFNFADCCVVIGTGLLIIYMFLIEPKETKKRLNEEATKQEE